MVRVNGGSCNAALFSPGLPGIQNELAGNGAKRLCKVGLPSWPVQKLATKTVQGNKDALATERQESEKRGEHLLKTRAPRDVQSLCRSNLQIQTS